MTALLHQRCHHHPSREAVSRCPSCKRYYCRECVIEHEGRLLCTQCLASQKSAHLDSSGFREVRWTFLAIIGVLAAWMIFYYIGALLVRIPAEFHSLGRGAGTRACRAETRPGACCPFARTRPKPQAPRRVSVRQARVPAPHRWESTS